jgi:predicted DCC family thiol-disulfide oxidoreductase YuxK
MRKESPIVFYDGECNLCDKSVRFILEHEKKGRLSFAHLNSEKGKEILKDFKLDKNYDSLLLYENEVLYGKSDAVLRIALYLKAPYSFLPFFFWVPLFMRDNLYDYIAKKRYSWFGKNDCIVMEPKLKDRFIS